MAQSKHGVFVQYGKADFQLSASELQLIADSLEIVSPDSQETQETAHKLHSTFASLAYYARSMENPFEDWQYEVANGDTKLGYKEWLEHLSESNR